MELPKELEEIVFEDPAVKSGIKPSEFKNARFDKVEGLYLEFEKTNDNSKKISGIFSKYSDIRAIAISAGKVLAVSEKPEGFSDDYLKGCEDSTKSFVYCFHGNDLCEENSPACAEVKPSL